jgi:hypothetical protein
MFVRRFTVRIRMTRRWQIKEFPFCTLEIGKVFDVASSVAMYLIAMHRAEPVRRAPRRNLSRPRQPSKRTSPLWHFMHNDAIAEARLKIAGKWLRLRVELDEVLMRQCSFYLERGAHLPSVR